MEINFKKITLTAVKWSRSLQNELTPNERQAVLVIVLLLVIGAVVKILRSA